MKYVFDNITDALAKSALFEFPLFVIVHASTQNSLNNSNNESGSDDLNGLLTSDGALVPTFSLSTIQSGKRQLEALSTVFEKSGLDAISMTHHIEAGTPAYEQFTSVFSLLADQFPRVHVFSPPKRGLPPFVMHGALLTPASLYDTAHTAIQLQLAPSSLPVIPGMLRGAPGAAAAAAQGTGVKLPALKALLQGEIDAMNREAQRSKALAAETGGGSMKATAAGRAPTTPGAGGGASAAAGQPTIASAAAKPSAGTPASSSSSSPAPALAGGSSAAAAAGGMHMVYLDGIPGARKRAVITTAAMDLSTMWAEATFSMERQRKVDGAAAAEVIRRRPLAFSLRVGEDGPLVASKEEASQISLRRFPSGVVVHVIFPDAPPPPPPPPQQLQGEGDTKMESPKKPEGVVCDPVTGVCMRPTPSASVAEEEQKKATSVSPPPPAVESPASIPQSINLRCTLPEGGSLDFPRLDPSAATLRADVRPGVAQQLGHDAFVFATAYPVRRLNPETDEAQVLKSVGVVSSSTLRVVLTDVAPRAAPPVVAGSSAAAASGSSSYMAAAWKELIGLLPKRGGSGQGQDGSTPQQQLQPSQKRKPKTGIMTMSDMLDREEDEEEKMANARAQLGQLMRQRQQPHLGPDAPMGPDREEGALPPNMAELLKQMQKKNPRKSERYFGGGSTEILGPGAEGGHDDDEEESVGEHENDEDDEHDGRRGVVPFSGTGHRLTNNPQPPQGDNTESKAEKKNQ